MDEQQIRIDEITDTLETSFLLGEEPEIPAEASPQEVAKAAMAAMELVAP